MRPTLFYIPNQIGPIPFLKPEGFNYGIGLLLLTVMLCGGLTLWSKYRREGTGGDFFSSLAMWGVICSLIVFVVPRLVDDVGLPIRGYGVMLLIAVVSGVFLSIWRARQVGANSEIIFSLMFVLFISGIVGARMLYVAQYWYKFKPEAWTVSGVVAAAGDIINMTNGGLVVYGALLGASAAFAWFVWRHKLPALALCDIVAASILLGQGLGRIGCLLNGCCYGEVCESPSQWGIEFPFGRPAHQRQVEEGRVYLHGLKLKTNQKKSLIVADVEPGSAAEKNGMKSGDRIVGLSGRSPRTTKNTLTPSQLTISNALNVLFNANGTKGNNRVTVFIADKSGPMERSWTVDKNKLPGSQRVHPTQIYSAINAIVICLFVWFYFPYRRRDGEVFAIFLSIFPITRFLMEWVRTDEAEIIWGMTISQSISIGLLLGAAVFWYFVLRQPKGKLMTAETWSPHNARWMAESDS